jgi:hypothetical protein
MTSNRFNGGTVRTQQSVMKQLAKIALCICATLASAQTASAAVAWALTNDNRLTRFNTATPLVEQGVAPISGRPDNEDLIGIDFRPSTFQLYGIGEFGTIYVIDHNTGAATVAGTMIADPADPTDPFTGLRGTRFGMDFDPVADRLRITSSSRQNLSVDVTTGRVVTDADLSSTTGGSPIVVGLAYDNNFAGATSTTLYGIDSLSDFRPLVRFQGSPSDGVVTPITNIFIFASITNFVGFDIKNEAAGPIVYTILQADQTSALYGIDLQAGIAFRAGTVGGGDIFDGFAMEIPEPAGMSGLTIGGLALIIRRRR